MDEDNVIRSSTAVDTSGMRAGLQEAANITNSQLAIIKNQYQAASKTIKDSVQQIVDAEKSAADAKKEAFAATVQGLDSESAEWRKLSADYQAGADQQRAALDSIISRQVELKEVIDSTNKATEHQISGTMAAGAEMRVLDGALPVRALENFLTKVLPLGPALQAAFPVFGAIAFVEILGTMLEKLNPLPSAIKDLAEAAAELDTELAKAQRDFAKADLDEWDRKYGKLAKSGRELANTQRELTNAIVAVGQAQNVVNDALDKQKISAELVKSLSESGEFGAAAYQMLNEAAAADKLRAAQDRLASATINLSDLRNQQNKPAENVLQGSVDQDRKNQNDAIEAQQRATQKLADADNKMLAQMRASHEATVDEEIQFWESLRRIESDNSERVYDMTIKLGNLYQERGKQLAEYIKRGLEANTNEQIRQKTENDRDLERWNKYFDEMIRAASEFAAREQAQADRIAEIRKRAATEIAEVQAKGTGQTQDLVIQEKKLQLEQQYSLQVEHTAAQQIAYQKQIAALDEQSRDAKLKGVQAEMQIAQAALTTAQANIIKAQTDEESAKAVEDEASAMKKIAALQQQINQLTQQNVNAGIQAQTKAIQTQQQQYQQFFNELNQGFTKSLNIMLQGGKKWQQELADVWKQTLASFEDMLLQMLLKEVESKVSLKTIEEAYQAVLVALHIKTAATKVATTASSDATTTGIDKAADEVKVVDAAGLAAANAYAAYAALPPLALAMAADAFSTTLALGQLETGTNYVPKGGLYELHEGESVTPKAYNPAAGGNAGTQAQSFHYHAAPGASQSDRQADIDTSFSHFKRQAKKFNR